MNSGATTHRPRQLFWKYVSLLVALLGVVLVGSACLEMYYSYQENKNALLRIEQNEAIAAAGRIEQFIAEVERRLALMVDSQWSTSTPQLRLEYLRLLREVPAITDVSYVDTSGKEQLRLSRLALDVIGSQRDLSGETSFVATRSGKTYFSPVYFRDESEPYMRIAAAGSGADGGVAIADVDLKAIWEVISRIKVGKAGHAYVVDAGGLLVAHPNISLVLRKTSLAAMPQVRGALGHGEHPFGDVATIAHDRRGGWVLTAFAPIPLVGWTVFLEQPLDEAFEPLYASVVRTGVIGLAGLGLSILASLFLARKIARPIQALRAGADRIGAGAFDQRIEIHSGDELEALGEAFNRMGAQLRESYAGLEEKVEARTRELAEAVDELKALNEVSQIVNSTLDLEALLTNIVSHAVQLTGSDAGAIYEFDEAAGRFFLRVTHGMSEEHIEALRAMAVKAGEGAVGRAVAARAPVQIPDILEPGAYDGRILGVTMKAGFRALLAVPLVREDRILGALVVRRRSPGMFPPRLVDLLETFAAHSTLALQNAKLFREIADKSQQLEVASRHKSDFLASMSHELRTPLNAILGFNEMILGGIYGGVPPDLQEPLTDIQNSGKHLLRLINNVLDLAKIEAGRMDLALSDYSVHDTVERVRASLRSLAEDKGLEFATTVPEHIPLAYGDPGRVTQCLMNLAGNALKFTREGRVVVSVEQEGDLLVYSVSDTGIGIAPDKIEAVFAEFRQGDATISSEFGGTGLGLSITKKFVEMHRGRVWVESELGKGSIFFFAIPLRLEESRTA
jgi:signal transduction histidine kinase